MTGYDTDSTYYLIHAGCPSCGEVVRLVEERPSPVGLMQGVEITADHCPNCGHRVGHGISPEWDLHEEHEIEAVKPTQERGE